MFKVTTAVIMAGSAVVSGETVDLDSHIYSFGGRSFAGRIDLLKDGVNAALLIGCVDGCAPEELKAHPSPTSDERIRVLLDGGVLENRDGRYYPALPILVGSRRHRLQRVVESQAPSLAPPVMRIVERLKKSAPDDELVFHLLWSRVLDQAWDRIWALHSPTTPGPEATLWAIYPEHPYCVGTNYDQLSGSGSIAVTWSPLWTEHIRVVMDASFDLQQAAWDGHASNEARGSLQRLGFLDENSEFRGFAYSRGDDYDALFDELVGEYAAAVDGAYDYEGLADALHIRTSDLFVVLLHETAYEFFRQLDVASSLPFPRALTGVGRLPDSRALVSVRLVDPARPEDEAVALLERSRWRGTPETTLKLREVTRGDPDNQRAWLYLGFSLYGGGEHRGALTAFRALADLTRGANNEHERRMRDWSHIWMGHMYDLLGERESAVAEYKSVLSSKSVAQYAQYAIGPITAGDWARERIEAPFRRR